MALYMPTFDAGKLQKPPNQQINRSREQTTNKYRIKKDKEHKINHPTQQPWPSHPPPSPWQPPHAHDFCVESPAPSQIDHKHVVLPSAWAPERPTPPRSSCPRQPSVSRDDARVVPDQLLREVKRTSLSRGSRTQAWAMPAAAAGIVCLGTPPSEVKSAWEEDPEAPLLLHPVREWMIHVLLGSGVRTRTRSLRLPRNRLRWERQH